MQEIWTPRCLLAEIGSGEADRLIEIFEDPETQRFLPDLSKMIHEKGGINVFLDAFNQDVEDGSGLLYGIYQGGIVIGFIAIMGIPENPFIFYAVHPEKRRHGYMAESIKALMEYMDSTGICRLLSTYVALDNIASEKILTQVGFILDRYDAEERMNIYTKQF